MWGTLHLIPDPACPEESAALAASCGACFEYNDFFAPALLDDPALFRERIALYRGLDRDRSRDTLHGAFLDVTVHSEDPLIRRASESRVRRSMDAAEELGVRGAVFHTGTIPNYRSPAYLDGWLERNAAFWTAICREYPEREILIENMFDQRCDEMLALAEAMRGTPNFGLCLDYSHAAVFGGGAAGWVERLAPHIRHLHINDHDGKDDLHEAVGDGVTDWALFDETLRRCGVRASVLIETRGADKQSRSIEFMKQRGIYPFGEEAKESC